MDGKACLPPTGREGGKGSSLSSSFPFLLCVSAPLREVLSCRRNTGDGLSEPARQKGHSGQGANWVNLERKTSLRRDPPGSPSAATAEAADMTEPICYADDPG